MVASDALLGQVKSGSAKMRDFSACLALAVEEDDPSPGLLIKPVKPGQANWAPGGCCWACQPTLDWAPSRGTGAGHSAICQSV